MDRLWGQAERVPEPSADSRRPGVSWAGALGDQPELHGKGADQQFVKHSVMWPRLEVPAERETEPGRKEPASAPG